MSEVSLWFGGASVPLLGAHLGLTVDGEGFRFDGVGFRV